MDNVSEGLKHVFKSNYKIDKLEKELKYSDTIKNRILLADEHLLIGNYDRALSLYSSCLEGLYKDDAGLLKKLVQTSYSLKDYPSAIQFGNQLSDHPEFVKSEERIAYAWALYFEGKLDEATQNFIGMDTRFSNYLHRLEYAKFLNITDQPEAAKQKLDQMIGEIDAMDNHEKRLKKSIKNKIRNYYQEIKV